MGPQSEGGGTAHALQDPQTERRDTLPVLRSFLSERRGQPLPSGNFPSAGEV